MAGSVLDQAKIQPYVHDCLVQVQEGAEVHRLRVFYKRHRRLRVNNALPFMRRNAPIIRGDFVVMRVGVFPGSVVNMRGRDTVISDWMIWRWENVL